MWLISDVWMYISSWYPVIYILILLCNINIYIYRLNSVLTHGGRVTHICVNKLTIIGSDNGLSPSRRQAIIWTNAGMLLIRPSGTNFSEILIEIDVFSFKKMHLKVLSVKWHPFCLGLNVLKITSFSWSKDCFYCRKFKRILTRVIIENHYQILKYIPNIEHSNVVTDSRPDFELAKDNQASSLMYAVFVVRIR